jgi:hypothetical protein
MTRGVESFVIVVANGEADDAGGSICLNGVDGTDETRDVLVTVIGMAFERVTSS